MRKRGVRAGAALRASVGGGLDAAEDGGDFALELGEVEVDDGAAGMQDDVDGGGELRESGADGLAQATLDAVAIDGLAEGLGNGEADARAGGGGTPVGWTRCVEVGELLAELLATGLVDELVVGVFAEAMGHRRCEMRRCEMRGGEMLSVRISSLESRLFERTRKNARSTQKRAQGEGLPRARGRVLR